MAGKDVRFDAPRGVRDVLPPRSSLVYQACRYFSELAMVYGYLPVETPIFEHTQVFERSVGEATEIVGKQMYTFEDRGGESLTLRPEGTAGVVRAFVQHSLFMTEQLPWRVFYVEDMFRYERPQAGRYRQFKQLGVEAIGAKGPQVDVEQIQLCVRFLEGIGVADLEVRVNSVGDESCRPAYIRELRGFLERTEVAASLCGECRERAERNPLRVFDCKRASCRAVVAEAPRILDRLCDECREHLELVASGLEAIGARYTIDHTLVRGLDYYTKTAFEVVCGSLDAAQNAIAGGGRYDGLVELMGGPPTPGMGFAVGLERALLAADATGRAETSEQSDSTGKAASLSQVAGVPRFDPTVPVPDTVVVPLETTAARTSILSCLRLASLLRESGMVAFVADGGRSLKAQLRSAHRLGARVVAIVGEAEVSAGAVTLKPLGRDHGVGRDQVTVPIEQAVKCVREMLTASGEELVQ